MTQDQDGQDQSRSAEPVSNGNEKSTGIDLAGDGYDVKPLIIDLTRIDREMARPFVIDKDPFDPKEAREKVRSQIALLLIGLLSITVLLSFGFFAAYPDRTEVKDLLALIFTPLIGIIGTVLGFYFGSETVKND